MEVFNKTITLGYMLVFFGGWIAYDLFRLFVIKDKDSAQFAIRLDKAMNVTVMALVLTIFTIFGPD